MTPQEALDQIAKDGLDEAAHMLILRSMAAAGINLGALPADARQLAGSAPGVASSSGALPASFGGYPFTPRAGA